MRKVLVGVAALYACSVQAQSSVTIYGVIDDGITYTSNIGGSSAVRMEDSITQGSRIGFRGTEDLGGGLRALFNLESGFNPSTGALRQGGLIFGRQAYVGLGSNSLGTVTIGRTFDQMSTLLRFHSAFNPIGIYAANPGDQDRISGEWLNNLVTYTSPDINGLKLAAQYGFNSKSAPTLSYGNAYSLSALYVNGPFSMGAATTTIHDYYLTPGSSLGLSAFLNQPLASSSTLVQIKKFRTAGAGVGWDFGKLYLAGVYTNTLFDNDTSSDTLHSLNFSARYELSPTLYLGGGVTSSKMAQNKWSELGISLDHLLSKRTDVYVSANYEHTAGGARAALVTIGPSANEKQLAMRVGIRHRF